MEQWALLPESLHPLALLAELVELLALLLGPLALLAKAQSTSAEAK
jgi:hypothetical protein